MKQEYKKIKSLERKAKRNQIKYIHAVINCNSRGLGSNILAIRLAILRGRYEKEFGGILLIRKTLALWMVSEPYRPKIHYGISRVREFNKELPF